MRTYRYVWGVVATVVVGFAVVCTVGAGEGGPMLLVGAVTGLFAGVLVIIMAEDHPARWRWTRRSTLWTAVGVSGVDALTTTWGGAGALVAVVVVASSPMLLVPARSWHVAWTSRRTSGPPESLTQRDLQRRWEWTTTEVRRPHVSLSRRLVLIEERRRLLDELQHRDPAHFDTWVVTAVPYDGPVRQRHRDRDRDR